MKWASTIPSGGGGSSAIWHLHWLGLTPRLRRGCAADVINITSVEAHTILKQNPVYTASKHALLGLAKATSSQITVQRNRAC